MIEFMTFVYVAILTALLYSLLLAFSAAFALGPLVLGLVLDNIWVFAAGVIWAGICGGAMLAVDKLIKQRDELRGHLDAIAKALHPEWEGKIDGRRYAPEKLAGRVQAVVSAIQDLKASNAVLQTKVENLEAELAKRPAAAPVRANVRRGVWVREFAYRWELLADGQFAGSVANHAAPSKRADVECTVAGPLLVWDNNELRMNGQFCGTVEAYRGAVPNTWKVHIPCGELGVFYLESEARTALERYVLEGK